MSESIAQKELLVTVKACLIVNLCPQLARKQKQAEEDKGATASSAVCDDPSTSGFTDIPLSLPYEEQNEDQRDPVEMPDATVQTSDLHSEEQQTSSSQTSSTSVLTHAPQSSLNVSTVTSQGTVQLTESERGVEEDGEAEAQRLEPQTTELGNDTQFWIDPSVSAQFEVLHVPSAPTLYPSLPTLEVGPVIQLCEEAVKNCEKEPAVLALPDQESSPPSLQPLESVAELSRSKLYPELPKTAPEIQVNSCTTTKHSIILIIDYGFK